MTCGMKVLGKRVIAKEIPKEKKEGILIVPEEKRTESIVEVVGINDETPQSILVGSKIMIKSHWLQSVRVKDKDYMLVSHDDILGVIDEAS